MTVTFQLTWTQIKDQNSISVSAIDITTQDITSSKLHRLVYISLINNNPNCNFNH